MYFWFVQKDKAVFLLGRYGVASDSKNSRLMLCYEAMARNRYIQQLCSPETTSLQAIQEGDNAEAARLAVAQGLNG